MSPNEKKLGLPQNNPSLKEYQQMKSASASSETTAKLKKSLLLKPISEAIAEVTLSELN